MSLCDSALLKTRCTSSRDLRWRTDGDEVFLYIEAINGRSSEQFGKRWEVSDRLRICHELRTAFDTLRQLKQDPTDRFVGE